MTCFVFRFLLELELEEDEEWVDVLRWAAAGGAYEVSWAEA